MVEWYINQDVCSAMFSLFGALVGGAASLLGTLIALRYEIKNSQKDREARYRQEYVSSIYREKLERYSSFLSGYHLFTAAVRTTGHSSPLTMESLRSFMDSLSDLSLSSSPEVEHLATVLFNMATQYSEGTISAQELGQQYLDLTEKMKVELSNLKESLPGFFQLNQLNNCNNARNVEKCKKA